MGGAYRLTDAVLGLLLRRAPALESLALPQCSRLDGAFLADLPEGLRCAVLLGFAYPAVCAAGNAPGCFRQRLL